MLACSARQEAGGGRGKAAGEFATEKQRTPQLLIATAPSPAHFKAKAAKLALLLFGGGAPAAPALDEAALRRILGAHGSVISLGAAAAASRGGVAGGGGARLATFATALQARAAFASEGLHAQLRALGLRAELLAVYQTHPSGLTMEEAAALAGIPTWAASKRISELRAAGQIIDTGTTRKGASGRQQAVGEWEEGIRGSNRTT